MRTKPNFVAAGATCLRSLGWLCKTGEAAVSVAGQPGQVDVTATDGLMSDAWGGRLPRTRPATLTMTRATSATSATSGTRVASREGTSWAMAPSSSSSSTALAGSAGGRRSCATRRCDSGSRCRRPVSDEGSVSFGEVALDARHDDRDRVRKTPLHPHPRGLILRTRLQRN
jgi:hypothetical protein